jgi:hypothetical protein
MFGTFVSLGTGVGAVAGAPWGCAPSEGTVGAL